MKRRFLRWVLWGVVIFACIIKIWLLSSSVLWEAEHQRLRGCNSRSHAKEPCILPDGQSLLVTTPRWSVRILAPAQGLVLSWGGGSGGWWCWMFGSWTVLTIFVWHWLTNLLNFYGKYAEVFAPCFIYPNVWRNPPINRVREHKKGIIHNLNGFVVYILRWRAICKHGPTLQKFQKSLQLSGMPFFKAASPEIKSTKLR